MDKKLGRLLIEELIRAMAILGILMYGAVPIAHHGIGIRADIALLGALGLSAVSFPVMVLLRLRTGREYKITSRRGWIAAGVVNVVLLLTVSTMLFVKDRNPRRWMQLLVGILLVGALTWWAIRASSAAPKDDSGGKDTPTDL